VTSGDPVGVVGGGIMGLAVARQLARSGIDVVVFEKEQVIGRHQTGHNSGVVHAGIYYRPGSAKATMCRRGGTLLRAYCRDRGLPWDDRGKLVVARDATEALANGVPGVRWLEPAAIAELEPGVTGRAALLSPATAVADFAAIARSFAADVTAAGGQVLTGTRVSAVRRHGDARVDAVTAGQTYRLARLVICAGLQADLLARAAGDEAAPEIVPFRGEYLRLRPHARGRVRHLIYPVPDPAYPFLGVHVTPRVDGEVDLGPNAVIALAREGYRRRDVTRAQLSVLARSAAVHRLARRNWRAGLRELRGSVSRRAFLAEVRTYLPWLEPGDVMAGPAGVRAQAVDPDGSLVDDFRIHRIGAVTAVRNAPSPAATASLAIAEHIVGGLALTPGTGPRPARALAPSARPAGRRSAPPARPAPGRSRRPRAPGSGS